MSRYSRSLVFLVLMFLLSQSVLAGDLTGTLTTPNTAVPISNATLTFTLNQAGVIAGQFSLATSIVTCYTSTSGGVVGLPNPTVAPTVALAAGTLSAGTYYVRITYYTATAETIPSPARSIVLGVAGGILVSAPATQPATATGYRIYIGTTDTGETRQTSVTGWGSYTQSAALAVGAAKPATNNSICTFTFNDAIIPTYTTYQVNVTDTNGNRVSGFPQDWYLAGSTLNITNQYPIAVNVRVRFPQPVIANPSSAATQSVNSPLTLNAYGLTAGSVVLPNNASPPASQAGRSVLYVNSSGVTQLCENGSACINLADVSSGGWSDIGTTVRQVTLTDVVLTGGSSTDLAGVAAGQGSIVSRNRLIVAGAATNAQTAQLMISGTTAALDAGVTGIQATGYPIAFRACASVGDCSALGTNEYARMQLGGRWLFGATSSDITAASGQLVASSSLEVANATANASVAHVGITVATSIDFSSTISGTGTQLPLYLRVGSITGLQIATTGALTIPTNAVGVTFSGTGSHDITASGGTLRLGAWTATGAVAAGAASLNIGSVASRFGTIFADTVDATSLVGVAVSGSTNAENWTINADNVSADTENMSVTFERGTPTPNAVMLWDTAATAKRFDFNFPIVVDSTSPRYQFLESDAGLNLKLWDWFLDSSILSLRTRTDADGAGANAIVITRGATTSISNIAFVPPVQLTDRITLYNNVAPTNGQLLIGNTVGSRFDAATLTAPAAGLTITNGGGTITFALANDLLGVEGLAGTGLATRTAADTWTTRSIVGASANQVIVTNGDGVAGNPSLSTPQDIHTGATTQFAGEGLGTAALTGGLVITSAIVGNVASANGHDYSAGSRWLSWGANAATNGVFSARSLRSDGTNPYTVFQSDTSGGLQAIRLGLGAPADGLAELLVNTMKVRGGFIYPTSDSTAAFTLRQADGTTIYATYDSTNKRVRFGDATVPTKTFDVLGSFTYDGTSLATTSVGPHAIGGATNSALQFYITGSGFVASDGAALEVDTGLSPAANRSTAVLQLSSTISEAGSGIHPLLAMLDIGGGITNNAATTTAFTTVNIRSITAGAGTTTATGLRVAAPTAATTNLAIAITSGVIKLATLAVASLPTCNAAMQGGMIVVTDASAATYNSVVAGGGANILPVMCDGTDWREH